MLHLAGHDRPRHGVHHLPSTCGLQPHNPFHLCIHRESHVLLCHGSLLHHGLPSTCGLQLHNLFRLCIHRESRVLKCRGSLLRALHGRGHHPFPTLLRILPKKSCCRYLHLPLALPLLESFHRLGHSRLGCPRFHSRRSHPRPHAHHVRHVRRERGHGHLASVQLPCGMIQHLLLQILGCIHLLQSDKWMLRNLSGTCLVLRLDLLQPLQRCAPHGCGRHDLHDLHRDRAHHDLHGLHRVRDHRCLHHPYRFRARLLHGLHHDHARLQGMRSCKRCHLLQFLRSLQRVRSALS